MNNIVPFYKCSSKFQTPNSKYWNSIRPNPSIYLPNTKPERKERLLPKSFSPWGNNDERWKNTVGVLRNREKKGWKRIHESWKSTRILKKIIKDDLRNWSKSMMHGNAKMTRFPVPKPETVRYVFPVDELVETPAKRKFPILETFSAI